MKHVAVLILAAGLLAGCATLGWNKDLVIEATGPWVAQVGKPNATRTIEGTGNRRIQIPAAGAGFCWSIQQQGEGTLRAYSSEIGIKDSRAETSVAYGVVTGCFR